MAQCAAYFLPGIETYHHDGQFFIVESATPVLAATVTLTANINLGAQLGFLDVNITGGTASFDAQIAIGMVDPMTDSPASPGKITGMEISEALLTSLFDLDFTGSGGTGTPSAMITLPLSATLGTFSRSGTLVINWTDLNSPSTITVDRDAAGALIANSSKQVLQVQVQHADKFIRAVKNYATMQNFDGYFSRTNSLSYTIQGQAYGIETLWLSHVTQDFVEEEYDGAVIQYWRATFNFYAKIKRGTDEPTKSWRFKVLDRGTVILDAGAPDGVSAIKDDDAIITAETNLDGSGGVWNGTTPYYLNAATFAVAAVANDYVTMYQTVDFNALSL